MATASAKKRRRRSTRTTVKRKIKPKVVRAGFRDPEHVKSVVLRMGDNFVDDLDELCKINRRSRRELIEIMISEAMFEYSQDPTARINPL